MNSILRIYVPSTLNVVAQHTEVLTVTLDLILDISKQPTLHDQVHYSLRIKSSCDANLNRHALRPNKNIGIFNPGKLKIRYLIETLTQRL